MKSHEFNSNDVRQFRHASFRSLLLSLLPGWKVLAAVTILLLLSSALTLTNPWLAGQLATSLLANDSEPPRFGFSDVLLIWLSVIFALAVVSYFSEKLMGTMTQKMLALLNSKLHSHLQGLPMTHHQESRRGELLALIGNDAGILSAFASTTLVQILPQLFTLLGALYLLAAMSANVALLMMLLVPIYFVATKLIGRRLRPLNREIVNEEAQLFATLEENLSVIQVTKAFNAESQAHRNFERHNEKILKLTIQSIGLEAMLAPTMRFLASAGILLLVFLSARQLSEGSIDAGSLVQILLYGLVLAQPISAFANAYGQFQLTKGAAQRIIDVLNLNTEDTESYSAAPLDGVHPIVFKQLYFRYPGRPALLNGVELTIAEKETIAITGKNGAGKSTLAHLLLRFIEPTSGSVLLGGTDIGSLRPSEVRSHIGLVSQNILLRNESLFENIKMGRPEATAEEVYEAAEKACAIDFITELPDGFNTQIGDQGVRLSGGQKQRVALARALIKKPSILILDEATAMFDLSGEEQFVTAVAETFADCIVVIITHRPNILRLADRVLVLENGMLRPA